jgi:hypothetical protein
VSDCQSRIAVIVSEFGAAANVGGGVETTIRTFPAPVGLSDYVASVKAVSQYVCITLGLEYQPQGQRTPDQRFTALLAAARQTLDENRHLTDGDDCTLRELRDAVAEIDGNAA